MQFNEAVMIIQPALATLFVFVFFIRKYIFNIACVKVMKTTVLSISVQAPIWSSKEVDV